jgi:alanyl-tRNA synthetase
MNNNKLLLDTLELFEGTIYRLLEGGKSILYDLDNPSKFLEDRAEELKKMEEERDEKVRQLSDDIKSTGKDIEKQIREIIIQKMGEKYSNTKKTDDIQYLLSKIPDLTHEGNFDIDKLNDILKQNFSLNNSLKLEDERRNNPVAIETSDTAQNLDSSLDESETTQLIGRNVSSSDDPGQEEEAGPVNQPQAGGRRKRTSKKLRKRRNNI